MIEITAGVAFLLSSMYGYGSPAAVSAVSQFNAKASRDKVETIDLQDRKAVEEYLRKEYSDTPILVEIARCESTFSQIDKEGKVIRGRVNSADVGVMQINEKYHSVKAEELGYDLHTIDGNIAFAKYLYEKYGVKPWNASSKCWSKKV